MKTKITAWVLLIGLSPVFLIGLLYGLAYGAFKDGIKLERWVVENWK